MSIPGSAELEALEVNLTSLWSSSVGCQGCSCLDGFSEFSMAASECMIDSQNNELRKTIIRRGLGFAWEVCFQAQHMERTTRLAR